MQLYSLQKEEIEAQKGKLLIGPYTQKISINILERLLNIITFSNSFKA